MGMTDNVSRIIGAGEWLEEYGRVCKEDKVACYWGKVWMELVTMMEEVGECVMYWIGKSGR